MEYEVLAGTLKDIDFAPASEQAEVLQNIRTIISTPKFSVPLNREFGLSATMLDEPLPVVQVRLTSEIIDAIQTWEPRAIVSEVSFEKDAQEGIVRPKVRVKLNEQHD